MHGDLGSDVPLGYWRPGLHCLVGCARFRGAGSELGELSERPRGKRFMAVFNELCLRTRVLKSVMSL